MDINNTDMVLEYTGDAFDGSAEPTIYMWENRMAVVMELYSTLIYIISGAFILSLIFILPGVRRTKLTSFLCLLSQIIVCAAILLALGETSWLTGSVQLNERFYSSGSKARFSGDLGIHIGLSSVNVTLEGILVANNQEERHQPVDYNERFYFDQPEQMITEHDEALRKGLPFPILTVTDLLKQDSDGFNWSRQLRQAGQFTSLMLYISLASWLITVVIMCSIPSYLPHMMQITGSLILASTWVYTLLVSSPSLHTLQIGSDLIQLNFGHTAIITLAAGAFSLFVGILLMFIQMNSNPLKQVTIMDAEQVVKDKKMMYNSNILRNSILDEKPLKVVVKSENNSTKIPIIKEVNSEQAQTGSVIIPMADIEKNFSPKH